METLTRRRTQNVSLDDVEARGLRLLARDHRYGSYSACVGLLIRAELMRLYGPGWRERLDVEEPADA